MIKPKPASAARSTLSRHARVVAHRLQRLDPVVKGLFWVGASGLLFVVLNTLLRSLALHLHPFQVQFLRYLLALLVMLPLVARAGVAAYWPKRVWPQFTRGATHAAGLILWFAALTQISMATTTAIAFMTPIFVMLGAFLMFGETMRWERWVAAIAGFGGVVLVVAPNLSGTGGYYNLLMLASSPVFAVSFLMTKALTRHERVEVIVLWQAISITVVTLPLALWVWQAPSLWQWCAFLLAGFLGAVAHYCMTRAFSISDISATQSVKFLDLVWASALGWLVFAEIPSQSTLVGGAVICAATVWIALRESRGRRR